MKVRVIGGFSSLAKSTMIGEWLSWASGKGPGARVTILLNGEEDFVTGTALVEDLDVQVELFAEGCFCCTLRDALTETLVAQRDERKPDLILMSASVIADLEQVGGLIRQVLGADVDMASFFGLDQENALPIIDSFQEMVRRNVRSADAVMLMRDGRATDDGARTIMARLREMNAALKDERQIDIRGKKFILMAMPDIEIP
jgi:G3E family GTPase